VAEGLFSVMSVINMFQLLLLRNMKSFVLVSSLIVINRRAKGNRDRKEQKGSQDQQPLIFLGGLLPLLLLG
jgi:hypothetical protein